MSESDSAKGLGGGGAADSTPGNVLPTASATSLVQTTEPPRGRDPILHHSDVAANLAAVKTALSNPQLTPPKIFQPHVESQAKPAVPAGESLGSETLPIVPSTYASNSLGLGNAGKSGVSEVNDSLVTTEYLAAAAEKFFTMSAEDVVELVIPIVPFFAACRGRWVEKRFSGAYLVLTETPAAIAALVKSWSKDSGEKLLTANEANAAVMLLAMVISRIKEQTALTLKWTKVIPANVVIPSASQQEGERLRDFGDLSSQDTFNFVIELCPHLKGLQEAWNLTGLTGRECDSVRV